MGTRSWAEFLALPLAALLLFAWIGSVPGLYGDEAWNILIAHGIAQGDRPLVGMTSYAGAFYPYLLAPVLAWTAWSTAALRSFAALCNLGALAFAVAALRRAEPSPAVRGWAALLLASSPMYVVQSRYAVEVTALTPLLAALALWLLWSSQRDDGSRSSARLALAGACFGLAGYNHAMALALPFCLALVALLFDRRTWLQPRVLLPFAGGFMLGFAPRIATLLAFPLHVRSTGSPAADLPYLPWVFFRVLDGTLLYRQIDGPEWLWVVPYALLALLALAGLRYRARALALERRDLSLAALIVALAVVMTLISPNLSSRYLLLPALLFPVFLARMAAPLFEGRQARMAHGVLGAVLALNVFYLAVDYYAAFRARGGALSTFVIGTRRIETSHEYVPTDLLYQQLVGRGIEDVICDRFIGWPLLVHDIGHSHLALSLLELSPPALRGRRTALVAYAAPTPRDGLMINFYREEVIEVIGGRLYRDHRFDPHFAVFVQR